jgi:hypothetical protein
MARADRVATLEEAKAGVVSIPGPLPRQMTWEVGEEVSTDPAYHGGSLRPTLLMNSRVGATHDKLHGSYSGELLNGQHHTSHRSDHRGYRPRWRLVRPRTLVLSKSPPFANSATSRAVDQPGRPSGAFVARHNEQITACIKYLMQAARLRPSRPRGLRTLRNHSLANAAFYP